MQMNATAFQKYQTILKERGIEFNFLKKSDEDLTRLENIFKKMDSIFLTPQKNEDEIQSYSKKLVNKAYNFILADNHRDFGLLSIYANDFINKISFINAIGILPSYQRKKIAYMLSEFAIEFSNEIGMELIKFHINKHNFKSLGLVKKFNIDFEQEIENDKLVAVFDLKKNQS